MPFRWYFAFSSVFLLFPWVFLVFPWIFPFFLRILTFPSEFCFFWRKKWRFCTFPRESKKAKNMEKVEFFTFSKGKSRIQRKNWRDYTQFTAKFKCGPLCIEVCQVMSVRGNNGLSTGHLIAAENEILKKLLMHQDIKCSIGILFVMSKGDANQNSTYFDKSKLKYL